MVSLALYSWPLITLALFSALGPARGLIWATVAGYLFLPEMTIRSFPLLPDYGKETAISYSLLLGMAVFGGRRDGPVPALSKMGRLVVVSCLLLIIGGAVMTSLTNTDTLRDADRVREALTLRDAGNTITTTLIALVPYALALRLLCRREMQREVLVAIAVMAAFYSVLVLYEWRMSPQINRMVYDFFPHDWRQHIRGGGFRPLVFLRHGLWLGFFLLSACLAMAALWRGSAETEKTVPLLGMLWLFLVLFLSRNLGALVLAVMFLSAMIFTTRRFQVRIAMICAVLFLTYPVMRQAELVPVDTMVEAAEMIDERRASSLGFRFENEKMILDRALEKPVFGWGGWGRWRVIDERGRDITVSDGIWVIKLGREGWVGYLGFFGLLAAPLILLGRRLKGGEVPPETAGLATIMGANFLYAVPNSTLSPIGFLVAGVLAAQAFRVAAPAEADAAARTVPPDAARRDALRYTRFGDRGDAVAKSRAPRPGRARAHKGLPLARPTSRSH